MISKRLHLIFSCVPVFLVLCGATNRVAAERLTLDDAVVIVDREEPSFIQYGAQELTRYLSEIVGKSFAVAARPEPGQKLRIVVGATAAMRLDLYNRVDGLGDEGYVIRLVNRNEVQNLVVTGATPRGTKLALGALMKGIQFENRSAYAYVPLDVVHQPPIARRGMHFNGWSFNGPYSFRTWREEDWKNYLDILAYQGVNLLYLWPFMEIMPMPLSAEDRSYLEECHRVIDYAHKMHGMEVWIMQCTNRVAKDDCGVTDPRRRPYWRPSQQDLNPGNSGHFTAIMASREALYKALNNVDGVCNIDSDPGEWPGSPLSDYVKVLDGCRELLDRCNTHGKQTKLINWMWTGWGVTPKQIFDLKHQRQTLEILKSNLREPWELVAPARFIPLCRKAGLLSRTVFLPYGAIEGEPAYPATNVDIGRMRGIFVTAERNRQLSGVIGNLQTPLLQFPHMYYYTSSMADADYRRRSERDVLIDVSGYLYPDQRELVADSYAALKETDPDRIQSVADRMTRVVREKKLGRPGLFGRKLFPDGQIVANSLILQLNAAAARERLLQRLSVLTSPHDCEKLLLNYFDAYLAWDTAHGWHGLWGWKEWPLGMAAIDRPFSGLCKTLAHCLGTESAVNACFERVANTLAAKYGKEAAETGCIAQIRGPVLASIRHR